MMTMLNASIRAGGHLCGCARALLLFVVLPLLLPSEATASAIREKIIIDTDIGSSIDDAFAVALALSTPELEIVCFSTSSGDTQARAKILDRMLGESRIDNIPVLTGASTPFKKVGLQTSSILMQRRYGESGHYGKASHGEAVDYMLQQIKRHPGEITLVAIGPLTNVAAMIDKDIDTVRKLKSLVLMGGWFAPIVSELGERWEPMAEHNVSLDIEAAQKVFRAGIPLFVIPLDATLPLKLDEIDRRIVFTEATPLTNALTVLYTLWGNTTPTLHDVMAVAFVTEPRLCPMEPMRITVDADGLTRATQGTPNAHVCMRSEPRELMDYLLQKIQHGAMDKE